MFFLADAIFGTDSLQKHVMQNAYAPEAQHDLAQNAKGGT
jgi:hypothetical protein